MNIERRWFPLQELRVADEGGKKSVTWYPAMFDSLSEDLGGFKEKIGRRAFSKTLQESDIRALFNHNPDYVMGRNTSGTLSLRVDVRGLHATVDLPDTQWANDLAVSMSRGDVSAGSFGFRILDDRWTETEDGYLRELREVQLFDVSVVTYPAYPETNGTVAMRGLFNGVMELDAFAPVILRLRAGQPLQPDERARAMDEIDKLRAHLEPEAETPTTPDVAWRLNLARRRYEMAR